MSLTRLFTVMVAGLALAACDSGDIKIQPTTSVSNSNNTVNSGGGGGANDICASYVKNGQTITGTADANGNCTYGSAFVGPKNNLTVDLLLPALPNGGVHRFTSSLFVGEDYESQAELDAAGIHEGGDGPTLTIEAGATLAFQSNKDFIIINRGSRILADGRVDAPITITSTSDVDGTLDSPEAVQQWGGIVINGFAVSNKCKYEGTRGQPGFQVATGEDCAILAEGSIGDSVSHYGGDNDADDSGILRYVVVKHTGAEVAPDNELNGISFGGVGSSTVIENLEAYSTYDDGIEMFGGAVSITNYVAVYVRDDSIDIDEGYQGTITNALVIQSAADGQQCIESDGIGSYSAGDARNADFISRGLNSRPTINNLTCIISPNIGGTHGSGAGWRFREGIWPVVNNSIVISSFEANDTSNPTDNACLRIDDDETNDAAANGQLQLNSVIFACQENANDNEAAIVGSAVQFATVADGTAIDASSAADPDLQLLDGTNKTHSLPWDTTMIDGAMPDPNTAPTSGEGTDILGAISATDDWTDTWTYGIHPDNRGQALWFE